MLKNEWGKIYSHILPVVYIVGSEPANPCYKIFTELGLQIARWFANFKDINSKELGSLVDTLFNGISSKENSSLREYCAECIGEFIKYTIKQRKPEELKAEHENIKIVVRRLQNYSGHPDSFKRLGALITLKKILKHIANEEFLREKYCFDLADSCLSISKKGTTLNAEENKDFSHVHFFLFFPLKNYILRSRLK